MYNSSEHKVLEYDSWRANLESFPKDCTKGVKEYAQVQYFGHMKYCLYDVNSVHV